MVLIDRNRHTAIVVGRDGDGFKLVRMDDKILKISYISKKDLNEEGFSELAGYPLEKAVKLYMEHSNITAEAKLALEELVKPS